MHPPLPAAAEACLRALARGKEEDFLACFSPQACFFGTWISAEIQGLEYIRWAFRAAMEALPGLHVVPFRTYGDEGEMGLWGRMVLKDGRSADALWVFRLDGQGRLDRVAVLWEPATLLAGRDGVSLDPAPDPAVGETMTALVAAFNRGDEDGLVALLSPDHCFRGSLSRVETRGRAAARGVFRGVRLATGLDHLRLGQVVGRPPEIAVRVGMACSVTGAATEGWWVVRFAEEGGIQRMAVLWNPIQLLKGRRTSVW